MWTELKYAEMTQDELSIDDEVKRQFYKVLVKYFKIGV